MASPTAQAGRRKSASKRSLPAPGTAEAMNGAHFEQPVIAAKKSKPAEIVTPNKGRGKKDEAANQKVIRKIKDETDENNDKENRINREVLAFEWTSEELSQLVTNLTACLPRIDNVKYTTLIDKLDWEKVRFGAYTASECKEKWLKIVTRLRRFRTLTDMVTDAKEWVKHPWSSYSSSKKQKHPAMPKKPLTPYFRYFLEKRERYSKDHPEMSMTDLAKLLSKKFQQLPDKKRQKYKESYIKENALYKQELGKFKKCHPEQFPSPEMRLATVTEGPEKPRTASSIYISEKLKKPEYVEMDRRVAMEKLRKQWNALPDNKRLKWIKKAVMDEQRYGIEIEKYCLDHPDFHPEPVKPVLNKAEKELKDRNDGKPERPPNSGYSLFSRIMLRELKDIPSKLKMAEISKKWKVLKDADREKYNQQAQKANAKYKESYALYLSKLPEKEREKIENEAKQSNKRKAPTHSANVIDSTKNDISELEAIDGGRPKKPLSAMFYFQQEKYALCRQKHPEQSKEDIMKMLAKEYNELADKKKDKYRKIAEEAKKAYDEGSMGKKKEASGDSSKRKLYKGEPRKPPQSGYSLFSTEMLSSLTDVDPKSRMGEIAKRWKAMTPADKDAYKKRVQDLMRKYNKEMERFLTSLSSSEFQEFEKLRRASLKMKSKKRKGNDQSKKNQKEESESDSLDDDSSSSSDDDEDDDGSGKSDNENDSASGSGSGSDSGSDSDDSGSDSDSDDDDDDDENKDADDNDSSSADSDSESDSGSGSGSDSSVDSSDSDSGSEEEKSG